MNKRCLRMPSEAIQFFRYTSTHRAIESCCISPFQVWRRYYAQQLVQTKDGPKFSPTPAKATYEPSPIFGAVRPGAQEGLKKSVVEKKKKLKKEKTKGPVGEDEKHYVYKSFQLATSVKKLGNLARQIAHKDIDYAIMQMRFSPKRVAQSVMRGLEHAKEEGIRLNDMKEGQVIVDQAWVGRGRYRKQMWPRARGRLNIRMRPHTHFTVLLKTAEAVNKRVAKVKQRKLEKMVRGMQLNKPIYNARPYYTW